MKNLTTPKTIWLFDGEERVILTEFVSTDRQTDGRTDWGTAYGYSCSAA